MVGLQAWRTADRLFDGLLPIAPENLVWRTPPLNARWIRGCGGAEIVAAGSRTSRGDAGRGVLASPFLDRIVLRAPSADGRVTLHRRRKDQGDISSRSLHLHR